MEKKKSPYNKKTLRYGMVEAGTSLAATMASTFFAIFLTNVVGLNPATMGAIISVAGIIDTISVPCIGVAIQKSHFKNGKYRPWVLWGGIVCAIFCILRFVNVGLDGTVQYIYYLVVYTACMIGLNSIQAGYTSLLLVIADDPKERLTYTSCAIQFNSIAKFVFGLVVVSLLAFFSGSDGTGNGYFGVAILVAAVVFVVCLQLYKFFKNLDAHGTAPDGSKKSDASILDMLKGVISVPALLFFVAAILRISTFFIINGLAPYYYQYVIGDKAMLTVFLSVSTLLMFAGATLTPFISRLVGGARNTYICGALIYGLAMLSSFLFKGSAIGITVVICIGYVGYAFIHSAEKAVYSTVADYAQFKSGKDVKGFLMSIITLAPKLGQVIQGVVLGVGLSLIGFDAANVTPEAINGFPILMSLIPAILMGITAVSMIIFPLTDKKVLEMQAKIKAQNEAAAPSEENSVNGQA